MNAKTVRIVYVPDSKVESDEGWTVPEGWRIVDSKRIASIIGGPTEYRITIVC